MPLFKDFNRLQKEVEKQLQKALQDDVSRVIYNALEDFVLKDIYNNYYNDGEYYQRTYDFLRSIKIDTVKKEGNIFKVKIYFDDKTYHESWWGGSKYNIPIGGNVNMSQLAEWLNDELTGTRPKGEFMEHTVEFLNATKSHIKAMIGYLKSKGIKII